MSEVPITNWYCCYFIAGEI